MATLEHVGPENHNTTGGDTGALRINAYHFNLAQDQINTNTTAITTIRPDWVLKYVVTGTSTSTTTDWGNLLVADIIMQLGTAGTGAVTSMVCATAGTLPEAGVISDVYFVYRNI